MSMDSTSSPQAGRPTREGGPAGPLRAMRAVLWLLATSVLAQPVFAGLFLDGHDSWRAWHATNGMALLPLLALTQLVLAVLAWRTGRGPGWLPLAGLGLFLAIVAQNLLGMNGQLALHVPLGVAIPGLVGTLLVRTRGPRRAHPDSQPTPSPSRSRSNGSGPRTRIGPSTYSGPSPDPPAQS